MGRTPCQKPSSYSKKIKLIAVPSSASLAALYGKKKNHNPNGVIVAVVMVVMPIIAVMSNVIAVP
jgi:hypothetical protein